MQRIPVRLKGREKTYEIKIGARLLSGLGSDVRAVLGPDARRVAIISNRSVFDLFGRQAAGSLTKSDLKVSHWLMADGERNKTLRSLSKAVEFLLDAGVERRDAVLAGGGGVVGDLAGFAAGSSVVGMRL